MTELLSEETSITTVQKIRKRKTIIQRLGISQIVLGIIIIIVAAVYIKYCNTVDLLLSNYKLNLNFTTHHESFYQYLDYSDIMIVQNLYLTYAHVRGIGFGSSFWLILSGILALVAGGQNTSKKKAHAHLALAIIACVIIFCEVLIESVMIHRIELTGSVRGVSTMELKGCLFTLIIFGLISIGPLIASAVLCAKLAPSSCCEPYPNNPGAIMYIPQDNSGHGYVPMQSSSVGQPQPGFTIQPQAGVAMQPQAGVAMQPQAGVAMQPQPGFTIQPQAGVAMQPQAGVAMQPQGMMIQPQGTMMMQQPYGYIINQSGVLQPYNFMMQTQGIQQPQQAQPPTNQQNANNKDSVQSPSALNTE